MPVNLGCLVAKPYDNEGPPANARISIQSIPNCSLSTFPKKSNFIYFKDLRRTLWLTTI